MGQKRRRDQNLLKELFPDVGFEVSVPLENLDDIVSQYDHIIIKNVFNCYCYTDRPKMTDYIDIKKKEGGMCINNDCPAFDLAFTT